jgi:hypothetical protein
MLAVSSAEWTGAGGFPALSAPQLGQHFDERAVAMVPDQQTHRIDRPRQQCSSRRLRQIAIKGVMRTVAISLPLDLIQRLDAEIDRVPYGEFSRSGAIEQFIREGLEKTKLQDAG